MTDSDYALQIKEFEAARDIAAVEAHKEMDCSYVIKWEYLQCWKDGADWGRNYERNWFWNQGHNLLAKNNRIKELEAELKALRESADKLVEAAKLAHMLVSHSSHTCLPINVREPDGSISSHRPESNEGHCYRVLGMAIENFRAKFPATNDEVKL